MVHRLSRLGRRDDGAVAVLTVILISAVFIGLCALVVDLGMGRDTRRQAQNAADASALAAGNVLYLNGTLDFTRAINAAKGYASTNYGVTDWTPCTDASALTYHPGTVCISFDSATSPRTVRVTIPTRQVSTPFAQIWGVSNVPVGAAAKVKLALAEDQCGLCVLGSGTHDLQNGTIDVSGTDVAINGTLSANPQASIIAVSGGSIDLQGIAPSQGTYSPLPLTNQPRVLDPLANLIMPDYEYLKPQLASKTNSCTDGPGIYDHLTACANMAGGLYVLTGQTHMSGNENIIANGVTLYFTCGTPALPRACTTGESGGDLMMTGNGDLSITAPATNVAPAVGLMGLAIVADRNNVATFSFRGNGAQTNTGTIYAPSGTLDIRGNGAENNLDSLVVVGNVTFSGSNATFQSTFTQQSNALVSSDLHLSE